MSMSSVDRITDKVSDVVDQLLAGKINADQANAVSRLAGRAINANMGRLKYLKDAGRVPPELKFFEPGSPA